MAPTWFRPSLCRVCCCPKPKQTLPPPWLLLLFILVEPAGCLVQEASLTQQRSVRLSIPLMNTTPTWCPWIFVAEQML